MPYRVVSAECTMFCLQPVCSSTLPQLLDYKCQVQDSVPAKPLSTGITLHSFFIAVELPNFLDAVAVAIAAYRRTRLLLAAPYSPGLEINFTPLQ
ncbi:hypothetical protein PoB_002495500 [Plakobranchus ocellatus]|uniref:Uncharacterized protein n=1 Tax=Plakobranchus ocellatus TaxID=259542 RepID=A0AAV3ZRR2_9GAST|nr:hypothetical protein PoB_002495500 [Plakobranchus ocellatus]